MSDPPVYIPPEGKNGQPGTYPQSQPGAYPQGQPGQPGAYPQGQPVAYPQGQPYYPQGQPVVYQQGQPGVYQPGQQQVVINQPGNASQVYHTGSSQDCCGGTAIAEHYNERAGFATGVIHLIIGILSIIIGGAAYAFPYVIQVGYGIWSAILFYIPTGILGIASKNKNSCVIIAYMVLAILTALHAFGMFSYEIALAATWGSVSSCFYSCTTYSGIIAVHSILAVLGLVEFIVAIVSAVYCCRGSACCCAPPPTNNTGGFGATTTTTTTVQYAQPQAYAQPMAVVANPR